MDTHSVPCLAPRCPTHTVVAKLLAPYYASKLMCLESEDLFVILYCLLGLVFTVLAFWFPPLFPSASAYRKRLKADFGLEARVAMAQQAEAEVVTDMGGIKAESYFERKTFAAIDYAIKRHDWFEDQRARMVQMQVTLATVVVTVLVAVTRGGIPSDMSHRAAIVVLAIVPLVYVIRALILYISHLDSDPPYRLVSDIRFWFFRYNLPKESRAFGLRSDPEKLVEDELAARQTFMARIKDNLDLKKSLREDLEQLYILQVLQRYKSESLSKLRYMVASFVVFILTVGILSIIYSAVK
jgi:hypothetical protein